LNQAGKTPGDAATLIWEQFKELERAEDAALRPEGFRSKLASAKKAGETIRMLLRDPTATAGSCDAALQVLAQSCTACHKQYRNGSVP
jgi:cytochrome c556